MKLLTSLLMLAVSVSGQTAQSYFPLEQGNQWVYRYQRPGSEPFTVQVNGTSVVQGRTYHKVSGFPSGDLLLRNASDGTTYVLDDGVEKAWIRPGLPEGAVFESGIDDCSPTARISSKNGRYQGPLGEYTGALVLSYLGGPCRDAGLSTETFLQFVGLVSRTETTIAGPRTFELMYAKIGGTSVGVDGLSFQLTLDRARYLHNLLPVIDPDNQVPRLTARITLRHNDTEPVVLTFPSSQRYDLVIRDSRGQVVYIWSRDKLFLQQIQDVAFPAGETNWIIEAPLGEGQPLPAGRYTAEAYLTTTPPRLFVASVSFVISDGR